MCTRGHAALPHPGAAGAQERPSRPQQQPSSGTSHLGEATQTGVLASPRQVCWARRPVSLLPLRGPLGGRRSCSCVKFRPGPHPRTTPAHSSGLSSDPGPSLSVAAALAANGQRVWGWLIPHVHFAKSRGVRVFGQTYSGPGEPRYVMGPCSTADALPGLVSPT